jgi:hypothetical protein
MGPLERERLRIQQHKEQQKQQQDFLDEMLG